MLFTELFLKRHPSVSLKRKLIRTLDNGVGRPLLSWLATAKARQILQADVVIAFDNGWYHRVDGYYVPDGSQFEYYEPDVLSWKDQISTFFRDSADFWFAGYTPKLGDIIVDVGAGRGEDILPFLETPCDTTFVMGIGVMANKSA